MLHFETFFCKGFILKLFSVYVSLLRWSVDLDTNPIKKQYFYEKFVNSKIIITFAETFKP